MRTVAVLVSGLLIASPVAAQDTAQTGDASPQQAETENDELLQRSRALRGVIADLEAEIDRLTEERDALKSEIERGAPPQNEQAVKGEAGSALTPRPRDKVVTVVTRSKLLDDATVAQRRQLIEQFIRGVCVRHALRSTLGEVDISTRDQLRQELGGC